MARAESSTGVDIVTAWLMNSSSSSVVGILVHGALKLFKELVDV